MKFSKTMLVCSTLVLSMLMGCSTPDEATTTETPATEATSETTTEGEKELVIWNAGMHGTDDTGTMKQEDLALYSYAAQFEEANPAVTVEIVNQPAENMNQLMTSAVQSQEGPDLAIMWTGSQTFDFADSLVDMRDYMTEEELAQYEGMDLEHLGFDPNGKVVGLPAQMTNYYMFYNKQVLSDAGIDISQPIKTWDEFIVICEQLKANGTTPLYVGEKEGYTTTWVVSEFLLDELGPEGLVKLRTGEVKFTDDVVQNALNQWKKAFDLGLTNPDFVSLASWDSAQQFGMSGAAFTINGSWILKDVQTALGEDLGVMQIPAVSADAPYADYLIAQPGTNVCVTTFSEEPELAVELAKSLTSAEFQLDYLKETGDMPSNKGVDISQIENPISAATMKLFAEGNIGIGFDSLINADASTQFYTLSSSFVASKTTAEELGAKVDEEIAQ